MGEGQSELGPCATLARALPQVIATLLGLMGRSTRRVAVARCNAFELKGAEIRRLEVSYDRYYVAPNKLPDQSPTHGCTSVDTSTTIIVLARVLAVGASTTAYAPLHQRAFPSVAAEASVCAG